MTKITRMMGDLTQNSINLFEAKYKNDKKSGKNMLLSTSIDAVNVYALLKYYLQNYNGSIFKVNLIPDEDHYKAVIQLNDKLKIYDFTMEILVDEDDNHHKTIFLLSYSRQPFKDYKIEDREDLFLDLFKKRLYMYLRPDMRDGMYAVESVSILHCNSSLDIYSIIMTIYHTLLEYFLFEDRAKEAFEEAVSKGLLERK